MIRRIFFNIDQILAIPGVGELVEVNDLILWIVLDPVVDKI